MKLDQQHNFNDTKYRRVTYWAEATTRFREYFPDDKRHPDKLTVKGHEVTLEVLSTARPAAPKIKYVIPTFGWESSTADDGRIQTSHRKSGLRVYLEGEWFSSGEAELLGVVLCSSQQFEKCMNPNPGVVHAPSGEDIPDPDDARKAYITQWGMDPIWSTMPLPDLPREQHFRNFREFRRGLSLAELNPPPGSKKSVPSDDSDKKFAVAGYGVSCDRDRRLWFADIELESEQSYFPFIRLALARYQPNSVHGEDGGDCSLSPVVLTDFMQLTPNRWAGVSIAKHDPTIANVSVYGVAARQPTKKGDYWDIPLGPVPITVEICLERRGTVCADERASLSLMWVPCAEPIEMDLQDKQQGISVWTKRIELPKDRDEGEYRVVLREFEHLWADSQENNRADISKESLARRLVYADVLSIQ